MARILPARDAPGAILAKIELTIPYFYGILLSPGGRGAAVIGLAAIPTSASFMVCKLDNSNLKPCAKAFRALSTYARTSRSQSASRSRSGGASRRLSNKEDP